MKRLLWRAVRAAYPEDTWYGYLYVTALYAGLVYASYAMITLWPWWKSLPMIALQLALGWLSVPFLEMLFPVRNKENIHEKSTDGGDGTGAARRG
jgi:hypothetical protein